MESKNNKLKRVFNLLYSMKKGNFIWLKFSHSEWRMYILQINDGVYELIDWNDKNISAGYECKDKTDLICTMLSDFNDGVLENISLKCRAGQTYYGEDE